MLKQLKKSTLAIAAGIAAAFVAVAAALKDDGLSRLKPADRDHILKLDPKARSVFVELTERAYALNPQARIVSSLRSRATQNALYAQGRTKPGRIITGARGCRSWHVLGRAVDFGGMTRDELVRLGDWWKLRGGKWGGDFSNVDDPVHFEYHPGLRIEQACPDPDGPAML